MAEMRTPTIRPYRGPAGGWGSAKSVTDTTLREHIPLKGAKLPATQNKPEGFMCVSCAWAKPAKTHPLEFCESGAKATAWEVTARRADPAFFARHTLTNLETWTDHNLEKEGRPADRSDALGRGQRQVCSGALARCVRRDWSRIAGARPAPGRPLRAAAATSRHLIRMARPPSMSSI